MTIATSGKPIGISKGRIRVTCVGGTSLAEMNQDNTGWVKFSGGPIVDGVIPDGGSFVTDEIGLDEVLFRFTGAGTVSWVRI